MRLLLLVPVVLLLAGCAATSQTGSSPTTSARQSSTPTREAGPPSVEVSRAPAGGAAVRPTAIMPVAPGSGPVVPVSQVDASAAPQTFGGTVRTDLTGTELQIEGASGGCSSLTAELTSQTADAVTVLLTDTGNPTPPPLPANLGCSAAEATVGSAVEATVGLSVTLAQPLGHRTVILTQLIR